MARAIAMLGDPNIVELYDLGQTVSTVYLVTQFIEGESLHTLLGRVGALAPPLAMKLIAQAARALHAAHRAGIVHGDLKTGNLLVRPDGRLLVSDFGIARLVSGELMTHFDKVVGDSQYISPAQVDEHQRRLTPLTDIYALGTVAYFCLTLTQPFPKYNPAQIALMYPQDPPPLPPDIPRAAQHVVLRALARGPRSRWSSGQEMSEAAAAAALGDPPHASR